MKIVVIGVGAMGSVYAGLLADAGNEVWAVDLWEEHLDAIREHGLRLEGASGERVVQGLHVAADPADAGPCDLVIIATKASGVASAARAIRPILRTIPWCSRFRMDSARAIASAGICRRTTCCSASRAASARRSRGRDTRTTTAWS